MNTNHFSGKGRLFIFIALLVALFVLAWLFPSAGPGLGMAFLVLSLLVTSYSSVRKHRGAYRQEAITRRVFLQNVTVEVTGAGLAMVLAGILGRALAGMATSGIGDEMPRFLLGSGIGLLAGIAVGVFVSRTWGRLVKNAA